MHVLEGGDCHYFPPVATRLLVAASPKVLSGKGLCDGIEFDYGSVLARLEIRADTPAKLRIGLSATSTQTKPEIALVLQLPFDAPLTLDNAGRKLSLKKAIEGEPEKSYELGRTLARRACWNMSLPKGSTLIWPHLPWNPYRPPTYRETLDKAVALLRVPLQKSDMRVEVVLSVAGGA